jgi:ATP-dependent phosphofructokinase / diphosphate-dependent phosphofructokinase
MTVLKGNAVVGQAGGPTVVINQSLVGVIQEVQKHPQIEQLLGARHGVRGVIDDNYIDLKRQPTEMLEIVARTPASALGATRDKPNDEYCLKIFEGFRKHNVRYFFYIGGNDSAQTANIVNKIAQREKYDLQVVHVPKTIDNDLLVTDHCPGFGSAAKFVASAFIGDNMDNRALPGVKINVLMGREAGFITAASILARRREDDGPHLIYLPERPFLLERFYEDVAAVVSKYGRCLVAVSEGIRDNEGTHWATKLAKQVEKDSFGNVQLSAGAGALGEFLAGMLKQKLPQIKRVRADTYGYLQRSFPGCTSEVDAWEARLVGQMGVSYAVGAGGKDGSVALVRLPGTSYAVGTEFVALDRVAPSKPPFTKGVPCEYISPAGNYITDKFLSYVQPLVGELPRVGWFEQVHMEEIWG